MEDMEHLKIRFNQSEMKMMSSYFDKTVEF